MSGGPLKGAAAIAGIQVSPDLPRGTVSTKVRTHQPESYISLLLFHKNIISSAIAAPAMLAKRYVTYELWGHQLTPNVYACV
jgi:hypothetical protein